MQAVLLPDLYPYILMVMALIAIQCYLTPFIIVAKARLRTFDKEMMDKFQMEHQEAFLGQQRPPANGYPDNGSGRYSQELTYIKWYDFNNAQRAHMNFVEQLPVIMILLGIAGLQLPKATLVIGSLYFVFRVLYTVGYAIGGPKLRVIGSLPNLPLTLALFGMSFYTASQFVN